MHFRQLEAFAAVYEKRNFARSAESLFISQPAVSQQILSLEKELGVTLFRRNRQDVTPTVSGDVFYPYARRLIALHSEALQALKPDAADFRIHFVAGDVHDPIQQVLLRFYAQNPASHIEILPPVSQISFENSSLLDPRHLYIVRKSWIRDNKISFFSIGRVKYSVLLSAADPLCKENCLSFNDIRGRILLHCRRRPDSGSGPFMFPIDAFIRNKVPLEKTLLCRNLTDAAAHLLREKEMYALILPFFVQIAGEEQLSRRVFNPDDPDDPIGLAFIGEANEPMNLFIRMALGCYQ